MSQKAAVSEQPSTPTDLSNTARDDGYCREIDDLYARSAHKVIGRMAASFLDAEMICPIELLHGYRHALKLSNSGTMLTGFVQQVAIAQVKGTKKPVGERVRELFALTDSALLRVKKLSEEIGTKPPSMALLNALSAVTASAKIKPSLVVLTAHLADAQGWTDKIDRLITLFDGAPGPAAEADFDQMLGDILGRPAALASVLGPVNTPEGRIRQVVALIRNEDLPEGLSKLPVPAQLDRLSQLLRRRALPASRKALGIQAVRVLAGGKSLASTVPIEEFRAIRRVAILMASGSMGGIDDDVRPLLEQRMGRVVTPENLAELTADTPELADKLGRAIDLLDGAVGAGPRGIALNFLNHLFGHRDFERDMRPSAPGQAEKIRALQQLLTRANLHDTRRSNYIDRLGALLQAPKAKAAQYAEPAPAEYVLLGGKKIPLLQWTADTLMFGALERPLAPGQQLQVSICVRTGQGEVMLKAEATVAHYEGGYASANYSCPDPAQSGLISAHFAAKANPPKS
jgi:hypothetical protein